MRTGRKVISLLLWGAMLLSLCPWSVPAAVNGEKIQMEGSGTEEDPYLIPDLAALESVRDEVNNGTEYEGTYFKVTNDIDMAGSYGADINGSEVSWTPIANYSSGRKKFKGIFDGGNHTISNLYINKPNVQYQGLFGCIDSGAIRNLTVSGNVTGKELVSLICGYNIYSSILNCHTAEGSQVTAADATISRIVIAGGGICGKIYGSKAKPAYISGCANGAAVSGKRVMGGIFGHSDGGIITDCQNSGTITGVYGEGKCEYIGGIGGLETYGGKTVSCSNTGEVKAPKIFQSDILPCIAGIVGCIGNAVIESCHNAGPVSGYSRVGGICGADLNGMPSGGIILGCSNSGTVEGDSYVGGICGEFIKENVTVINSYNVGSVSGNTSATGGICGSVKGYGGEGKRIAGCYNVGYVDKNPTDETDPNYDPEYSNVYGMLDETSSLVKIENCYYKTSGEAPISKGCAGRTEEQFASGEVAYLLQQGQDSQEIQVWGQNIKTQPKDPWPVLSAEMEKKICKVTFGTEDVPDFAAAYANAGGTVSLPAPPVSDTHKFVEWLQRNPGDPGDGTEFTADTPVTADMALYAVCEEMYGENDGEHKVETTYGKPAQLDLSSCVKFAVTEETAGKFTYSIESGNHMLGASVNGDILTVPETAGAKESGHVLTVKACKKSQDLMPMSAAGMDIEGLTFDVTVIVHKAAPSVVPPTARDGLVYNGESQQLIIEGRTTGGEMQYSLDGENYSASLPTGEGAGVYTVYYKSVGNDNYTDTAPEMIEVRVSPAGQGLPEVTIDYVNELLSTDETMEYSTDQGSWQPCTDHMAVGAFGYDGSASLTVYIRRGATGDKEAGEAAEMFIPLRPSPPDVQGGSGMISNTTDAMEYRAQSGGWIPVTGTEITGLEGGIYEVRFKASSAAFASEAVALEVMDPLADTVLEAGESVTKGDVTVTNGGDGKVTIDRGGENRIIVELPEGGSVIVDKEGKVTVPGGGKIALEDSPATVITLPPGGTVQSAGEGGMIVSEGSTIQTGCAEITVGPGNSGKVDSQGCVTVGEGGGVTVNGDPMVTVIIPGGGQVRPCPDGSVILPGGALVKIGDNDPVALPSYGGTIAEGQVKYHVSLEKEGGGTASVSSDFAAVGTEVALTAVPDEGFHLKEWQVVSGGVTIRGSSFIMPFGDVTVRAVFEKDPVLTPEPSAAPEPSTAPAPKPPEKVSPQEVRDNSVKLDSGTSAGWKKDRFSVAWKRVTGADGYDIYAAQCGKKLDRKSLVKTVKGKKSSISLVKIAGRKIVDSKPYKVKIRAYRIVNGRKVYIGSSKVYHVAGKKSKYTNAKKVKVRKNKITLKKGRDRKIKAKIVKQSRKKELLSEGHGPALRYHSTNTAVAAVSAKGKIRAKKRGTCYIYITALNGAGRRIKVTVK